MGVMSCYRKDCESIMCDTYIDGVGYVCRECQDEFKEYVQENGIVAEHEGEITTALKSFMETSKGKHLKGKEISIEDYFNEYRRNY